MFAPLAFKITRREETVVSRTKIRVLAADTDAVEIVYYATYFRYFEIGRSEWFREHDKPFTHYTAQDMYLIVTEAHCRYVKPARYDDLIEVECRLGYLDRLKLRFDYRIVSEAGELIADGYTWHVAVSKSGRVRRFPREIVDRLGGLVSCEGSDG